MNQSSPPPILIAGAGPAGISASLILSQEKIPHVIVDKAVFPRDKICGDALSGKVTEALNKINRSIHEKMSLAGPFTGSYGVSFFAPNGRRLDIPFSLQPDRLKHAPGYLSKRLDFDHFLFKELNPGYAEIRQNTEVVSAKPVEGGVRVTMKTGGRETQKTFSLVIAAEGDRSVIRRDLTDYKKEKEHYCAGIRGYFSGVKNTHEQHFIELHFIKESLPGYLWIFPMKNGICNVGIGMLSSVVSSRKANLKEMLSEILKNHPTLKERFKEAKQEDEYKGWGLPLGSKKYPLSGDHFLLTGDAASLIDPFTGEGIGNAMLSGILAGRTAARAFSKSNFKRSELNSYDREAYERLWKELRLGRTMQKLSSYPFLFNFVVNKALKSQTLRETITCMFEDIDLRNQFSSPSFYLKLIMGK